MADELTEEEIIQREKLIEQMLEQLRVGETGIDAQIKLYLETTRTGKSLSAAGKATKELTGGFKDAAKAVGGSTGNFGDLTAAVSSTVGAVTGLLGKIPIVGGALAALGDAAVETATFAFGQVQQGFDSFQDLSKAGQIGAGGISEMAAQMRATNMPLATYSKLLRENSADLAHFSTSALDGGKSFSKTMEQMAGETGRPLRRLGMSIEEIGDTVVDFQVMNRRQGLLNQLSQEEIRQGTAKYAKELDLIARLTGKSREEVQKEREAALSDSRFRASLAELPQGIQDEHIKAIQQINDPQLKRAYMDQLSGFTNSAASVTMEISGMGGSIRETQKAINEMGASGTDAVNAMREQAREVTKAGNMLQQYSKVVESGGGVMANFADLSDFAIGRLKDEKDAAAVQLKALQAAGSQTDKLVGSMMALQESTSAINNFFIATPAATWAIDNFAKALNLAVTGIEELVLGKSKNEAKEVQKTVANADFAMNMAMNPIQTSAKWVTQKLFGDDKTAVAANARQEVTAEQRKLTADTHAEVIPPYDGKPTTQPIAPPAATLATAKARPAPSKPNYTAMAEDRARLEAQADKKIKEFYEHDKAARGDNNVTQAETAEGRAMLVELNSIREELRTLNSSARQQTAIQDKTRKAVQ